MGYAVDCCSAPIVAAENDAGEVVLAREGGDGVGVGAEAVVFEVWGVALVRC